MLTDAQAAELAVLRARVYGPGAPADAATVQRLTELEHVGTGTHRPLPQAGVAGGGGQRPSPAPAEASTEGGASTRPAATAPSRRRRAMTALLAATAAALLFAGGLAVGAATAEAQRPRASDLNTGIPEAAAQTLDRIRSLQPWDADTLQFVGSIRQVTVWVGYVRNGRSACAVFDRPDGPAGDSTQIDCRQTQSDADYPLRLQWVREFSGLRETFSVLLRASGDTQLSYSTT